MRNIVISCIVFFGLSVAQTSPDTAMDSAALLIAACQISTADSLQNSGFFDAARESYLQCLQADSTSLPALLGMGAVYFEKKQYDSSIAYFTTAHENGAELSLYQISCLGAAYGRIGQYENAVRELGKYKTIEGDPGLKSKMRGQLAFYESEFYKSMAEQIHRSEQSMDIEPVDSLIVVIPFKNVSAHNKFDPLQKGLADMLITDLSQVESVRVVERMKIQLLLQELALDQAGVVKNENRIRVSRLLGASRAIAGIFDLPDTQTILIKGGYIEAVDGRAVSVKPAKGDLNNFFQIEKEFVFSVLDRLGIVPTDMEREHIYKAKTESLLSFLAYSEGLDAQDRGDFKKARDAYSRAAQIDPAFTEAGEKVLDMEAAELIQSEVVSDQLQSVVEAPVTFEGSGPPAITSQEPVEVQTVVVPAVAQAQKPLSFVADGSLGRRMSSMAGGAFMWELPVENTASERSDENGETTVLTRPDYIQVQGLGFGSDVKQVPLTVELPEGTTVVP